MAKENGTAVATKLQPLADRVVVKPAGREETTKSGIVLPDTAKEKPQRGTVIAAGLGRRDEDGDRIEMDVKVGDAVLFARGQGSDRWRWRLPKLRALGPSPFLERYLDVMLVRRGPSEPLCAFVARQLDAAQGVAETLRHDTTARRG